MQGLLFPPLPSPPPLLTQSSTLISPPTTPLFCQNTLLTTARAVFFFLLPNVEGVFFFIRLNYASTALYYLEEVPTLLMLTLYTQQVLKLAETYHVSMGEQERYRRRVLHWCVVGNASVVVVQVLVWCAYFNTKGRVDPDVWSVVAASVHGVSFTLVAMAMGLYGSLNSALVRKQSMGVALRLAQLRQSLLLSVPCTLAFLLRAIALAGASWANYLDLNSVRETVTAGDAAASIVVYFFTELMPLGAILYFNRLRVRAKVVLPVDQASGAGYALLSASAAASGAASPRGTISPSAIKPQRFSFSPKKGGGGSRDESSSSGGFPAGAGGEGGASAEPQPPPPLPPPVLGTAKVFQGLLGMVYAAMGVVGSGSGGEGMEKPGERTSLLGGSSKVGGGGGGGGRGKSLGLGRANQMTQQQLAAGGRGGVKAAEVAYSDPFAAGKEGKGEGGEEEG